MRKLANLEINNFDPANNDLLNYIIMSEGSECWVLSGNSSYHCKTFLRVPWKKSVWVFSSIFSIISVIILLPLLLLSPHPHPSPLFLFIQRNKQRNKQVPCDTANHTTHPYPLILHITPTELILQSHRLGLRSQFLLILMGIRHPSPEAALQNLHQILYGSSWRQQNVYPLMELHFPKHC